MNAATGQIFLSNSQIKGFSDCPDLGFSISGSHSSFVRGSGSCIAQPAGHKERAGKRKGSANTILPSVLRSTLCYVLNIRFIIPAAQYPTMAPAGAILIPHHSSGGPFLFPFYLLLHACVCISPPRNPPGVAVVGKVTQGYSQTAGVKLTTGAIPIIWQEGKHWTIGRARVKFPAEGSLPDIGWQIGGLGTLLGM